MAIMIGTLFGPSQVFSRFTNMVFGGGLSQLTLALISAVLLPAALVILIVTAPSVLGALVFAVVFGLGSGLSSIVQVRTDSAAEWVGGRTLFSGRPSLSLSETAPS